MAACLLITTCVQLCGHTGVAEHTIRFLPSAQLLLRCGAAAQQFLVEHAQRGTLRFVQLDNAAGAQIVALSTWQQLVCRLPPSTAATTAVLRAFFPPPLLHRWLQQTLSSLRELEPHWKPGGQLRGSQMLLIPNCCCPPAKCLPALPLCCLLASNQPSVSPVYCSGSSHAVSFICLCITMAQLATLPPFAAHAELLWQDKQLCSSLLQLLLPGISAMAVGLQLPPERRSPECTWRNAAHMAAVVTVTSSEVLDRALAPQPQAARRLLLAATQLLQHCPLPAPAASVTAYGAPETTLFFVGQLGRAADVLCGPPQQPPAAAWVPTAAVAASPDRRQVQQLLAVLPRVGEAVIALAQPLAARYLASVLVATVPITHVLAAAAKQPSSPSRPTAALFEAADLPAWCHTTATALGWLPCLAAAAVAVERGLAAGNAAQLTQLITKLCSSTLELAVHVTSSSYTCLEHLPASASPALSQPAEGGCLPAVWELHTAACRLVHWAQEPSVPASFRSATAIKVQSSLLLETLLATVLLCDHAPPSPAR